MTMRYFLRPCWALFCLSVIGLDVRADDPITGLNEITIPTVDLDQDVARQVVVDKESGQYLGHVTTVLLEDGKTIIAVYPKGHGRGAIVMKRSRDGGKTWSPRLPTPDSWATSKEVPTIHRVIDPQGTKRLIMWSGLYPARLAVSENDGQRWSELEPVGDWGGIVVMGFVEPLKTPGHYSSHVSRRRSLLCQGWEANRYHDALQDLLHRWWAHVVFP